MAAAGAKAGINGRDDDSTDGTGALADEVEAGSRREHVLHRPGKQGLGEAYVAGFRWGIDRDFDTLVEMDADLSHSTERLPAWWKRSRQPFGTRWTSAR